MLGWAQPSSVVSVGGKALNLGQPQPSMELRPFTLIHVVDYCLPFLHPLKCCLYLFKS